MPRREDIAEAQYASWAIEHFPGRVRATLAIVGGSILFFVRDTSSGTPAVLPRELAPIRKATIDALRGFAAQPFTLWSLL